MEHKYFGMLLTVLIVLSGVPLTYAENSPDIVYVSTQGNDNNTGLTPETSKKTIQKAIKHVENGGTIHIRSGTYKETLTINKDVRLVGEGPGNTILNGEQKHRCITIKTAHKILV